MAHMTSHGKLLLQRLHQQREMDFLCDITIAVKDVEFRAHRNILAAFSMYFSSQASEGQEVMVLDQDKVSWYALEKLLEFVYTGQMSLSSNGLASVNNAAVFLGMPEATQYLKDNPNWADPNAVSQTEATVESALTCPSTAAEPRPSSPVAPDTPAEFEPLSVSEYSEEKDTGGGGGEQQEEESDGKKREGQEEEAEKDEETVVEDKSDEDYTPPTPRSTQRGQGRKRGRKPKMMSADRAISTTSSGDAEAPPLAHRGRGRGRGRRGRGRGIGRSKERPSGELSDAGMKEDGDMSPGGTAAKRARRGSRGGKRGRGSVRGRGRRRDLHSGSSEEEEKEEDNRVKNSEGEGGNEMEGMYKVEDKDGDWVPDEEKKPLERVKKTTVCSECNKVFTEASSLRRHMKIHRGLKPFKCIFCSKTFRQGTQLKTHLRIHTGEKPFSCTHCEKCFAQKCQLVAHCRMYHGEEKPYTCERCGLKFATSSNYKIHIRLHSGEKPYVCDVCGQAFAQSSTLTYHKRRHTGEKPYQCDTCGMSFSVSSSLITHARKHTGETPYKCPHCETSFATSSEMKKHIRRLHPEGNPGVQCLLCGNRFASVRNMIKHQEKAHADEVRHHKERARAVFLLASTHPVAIVQSKLAQGSSKSPVSVSDMEPHNPEPATPDPKVMVTTTIPIHNLKTEPSDPAITSPEAVNFEPDSEPTISSDTLHALVEQLRPTSPAQGLQQIVIIRTLDNGEPSPSQS
ncbi:myoneurin-like isoform X2 [Lampris incognitus]|nr:myoneurin-like isoform X2 [Lampris incognitus]